MSKPSNPASVSKPKPGTELLTPQFKVPRSCTSASSPPPPSPSPPVSAASSSSSPSAPPLSSSSLQAAPSRPATARNQASVNARPRRNMGLPLVGSHGKPATRPPQTSQPAAQLVVSDRDPSPRTEPWISCGNRAVEHLGDECGDRAALGPRERDVAEQRVALERLDHGDDAVVPAHAQVVALGDVVREHDPAALAHSAERGEQHGPLEVLRLVDDHEAVGQAAAANVGERQHLEQPSAEHLVDDL